MISVEQARRLILKNSRFLPPVKMPLPQSLGLALAQEVKSPSDYPLYDVSAMDGYAFKSVDTKMAKTSPLFLKIRGTQQAGDPQSLPLRSGECRRVMTGGVIPRGTDTVLERELVVESKGMAVVSQPVRRGRNIRYRGEGIRKGSQALKAGSLLHSRAIGFLASLGVDKIWVHPSPRVALIVTGNELVMPGNKLKSGEIYNSNQWMLETALRESGLKPSTVLNIPDHPAKLTAAVKKNLVSSDILLLIGGVSVGDSDFSKPVLKSLGVKQIFWRVRQKPGFPLYFGKKGKTLVFGLPGNPASAWVNFQEYVVPCLKIFQGLSPNNPGKKAKLVSDGPNRGFKTLFLKARFEDGVFPRVTLLKGQGSHLLQSLAEGNALAVIPPGKGRLKKGATLEVHPLPDGIRQ